MEEIGGKIGKFVSLEKNWEQKVGSCCVKIMIEFDLRDRLYEEILLRLHGSLWKRRLDYWKIPLCCFSYKQDDHIIRNCLIQVWHKNVWVKKIVHNIEGDGRYVEE